MQCRDPCWTSAQSGSAALQSKHKSLPGTHLIFSMAFGGSGWAGGLREVRGLVFAVDISYRCDVPRLYPINGLMHLLLCLAQAARGDGVGCGVYSDGCPLHNALICRRQLSLKGVKRLSELQASSS